MLWSKSFYMHYYLILFSKKKELFAERNFLLVAGCKWYLINRGSERVQEMTSEHFSVLWHRTWFCLDKAGNSGPGLTPGSRPALCLTRAGRYLSLPLSLSLSLSRSLWHGTLGQSLGALYWPGSRERGRLRVRAAPRQPGERVEQRVFISVVSHYLPSEQQVNSGSRIWNIFHVVTHPLIL